MNAYVDIGGSEVLSLKGALLVYRGRSRAFVTWHEVRNEKSEGAPFLGEAQEVTTDFVHHLAERLGTAIPTEILPENVLARTAETMAWWTPAIVRIMFFAAHDAEAYRLSGRRFCQPPLVWKVTGRELWTLEGHLDKVCLELIGLDASPCRPPIRDIRPRFREKVRAMLQAAGVPRCATV